MIHFLNWNSYNPKHISKIQWYIFILNDDESLPHIKNKTNKNSLKNYDYKKNFEWNERSIDAMWVIDFRFVAKNKNFFYHIFHVFHLTCYNNLILFYVLYYYYSLLQEEKIQG